MAFPIRMTATCTAAGLIFLLLFAGCINYSSYQDAHIVERGVSQGTVAASVSEYEETDTKWFPIEVSPRWRLGDRFDWALKMSALISQEDGYGWVTLGGDVRAGIVRDHLAVTLPVSVAIGDYMFSTTNLQPGFIVTLPLADWIDLNGAARVSFYLNEELNENLWWLYNAGFGVEVAPGWRLRPEVAWMVSYEPDEPLTYMQFGMGVTREVVSKSVK